MSFPFSTNNEKEGIIGAVIPCETTDAVVVGVAVPGTGLACPGFDASLATGSAVVTEGSTVVVTVAPGTGVDLHVERNKSTVSEVNCRYYT